MSILLKKGIMLDIAYARRTPAILYATHYLNSGALALVLTSDDDLGEPLAKISVNIENVSAQLPFNEFVCKSYAENEGMEEWLLSSGLAEDTGKTAIFGLEIGLILRLNEELSTTLANARKEALQ